MQNVSTECRVTTTSTPVPLELPSLLSALRMSPVLNTLNVWSDPANVKPNLLEMASKFDLSRGKSLAGSKTLTFFIWRNWKSWKDTIDQRPLQNAVLHISPEPTSLESERAMELCHLWKWKSNQKYHRCVVYFITFSKQEFYLVTHTITSSFALEERDSWKHAAHFSERLAC